jgi:hypothetical protein
MTKPHAPVQPTGTAPNPVTLYNHLMAKGFSPDEAAMHVASLWGLQVTQLGSPIHWTIGDITNLLFLAHRIERDQGE